MKVLGLELCDAGLLAAGMSNGTLSLVGPVTGPDLFGWPAVAHRRGERLVFGPEAEAIWFEQPRCVSHLFLEKLSHETADFAEPGPSRLSFSQVAYYFLKDFNERLRREGHEPDKVVLAVPGAYLRDAATEEERIGLLLGIADELKLPLVRIIDLACAALFEPAAREFPRGLPIIHVDVHLHGTEISLLRQEDALVRTHYHHVPLAGYAQILRHLKNAMGNRFLRHTAFDIHEDRRLEQAFYEQTKQFLLAPVRSDKEFLYQLNTGQRSYQMAATRTQLESDLLGFEQAIVQGVTTVAQEAALTPSRCVLSLSDRAARLDGLMARLRDAGFSRLFALRPGAAALGAAALGDDSPVVADLGDVPVDLSAPLHYTSGHDRPVESILHRPVEGAERPAPSHVIVDGIGHVIGHSGLTLGTRHAVSGVDVPLPEAFDAVGDYVVRILRDRNGLRLELPGGGPDEPATPVNAGDRLALRSGTLSTEVLFAHCHVPQANGRG